MSDVLGWSVTVALIAAMCVGFFFLVRADDRAAARERRDRIAVAHLINRICKPAKLVNADYHGSGWSNGPWWEIQCSNGAVKVVPVL